MSYVPGAVLASFLTLTLTAAEPPRKTEVATIRGEVVGFSAVSPALQKQLEARNGKKPEPNPNAKGPNAHVGKHGFTYVSKQAKGKK